MAPPGRARRAPDPAPSDGMHREDVSTSSSTSQPQRIKRARLNDDSISSSGTGMAAQANQAVAAGNPGDPHRLSLDPDVQAMVANLAGLHQVHTGDLLLQMLATQGLGQNTVSAFQGQISAPSNMPFLMNQPRSMESNGGRTHTVEDTFQQALSASSTYALQQGANWGSLAAGASSISQNYRDESSSSHAISNAQLQDMLNGTFGAASRPYSAASASSVEASNNLHSYPVLQSNGIGGLGAANLFQNLFLAPAPAANQQVALYPLLVLLGNGNPSHQNHLLNSIGMQMLARNPPAVNPQPTTTNVQHDVNARQHTTSTIYGNDVFNDRDANGIPYDLPTRLALPDDHLKLSIHQTFLRLQIEAFRASGEDVSTHTRGRNKPVQLGQVGIRCRHCAHIPVRNKQKGSAYFPAAMTGIYQAAQNMSTTHLQCGLCSEMPSEIKHNFAQLLSTKSVSSGAGRPYWAQAAKKLGLVDTDNGIRYIRDLPRAEASIPAIAVAN